MWFSLAIVSALFSATAAIFEKKVLINSSPLNFSIILALFNVVLSLPFLFFINYDSISTLALLVLYFKSILGAASFLLIMHALKKMEISSALPLLVLTPALVSIAAFFVLRERLNNYEIIGMITLLIGSYLLQIKKGKSIFEPLFFVKNNKAYWFIIGALLTFTLTAILDKALLGKFKLQPEAFIPIQHLFLFINFSIMLLFSAADRSTLKNTFALLWKTIIFISALTIVYRYSHIMAIKVGSVALVMSIKRTSVFFATVIGGQYFKEQNLLRKALATAVMIIGAIFMILF